MEPTDEKFNALKASASFDGVRRKKFKNSIILSDLEKRNLTFQFTSDGAYKISAGNKIIGKGTEWGITKDGSYLYLDSEISGENFIEIISIKQDQLTIEFAP